LQTATFALNLSGTIRFEIRKTDGTSSRVNFDDFSIGDYAGTGGSGNGGGANNTIASANSIPTVPATNTGYISVTNDVDYFSISATSGQIITSGLTVPSGVDYNLYLLNSSGVTLASSANTSGSESITYSTTAVGPYYILVSSTLGSSATLNYTLTANVTTGAVDTTTSTSVHLTMGNPSVAVHDIAFPANYLMEKPQYVLSYNRDYGIPNWTAWHLIVPGLAQHLDRMISEMIHHCLQAGIKFYQQVTAAADMTGAYVSFQLIELLQLLITPLHF